MNRLDLLAWGAFCAISTIMVLSGPVACKGAVVPTVLDVVNVVEKDLEAGDTPAQIDSDVCAALGGTATTDAVCADVTVLVQDAIALLVDGGVLKNKPAALAAVASYTAAHPTVGQ